MSQDRDTSNNPYKMEFDVGTIKHLGLQMYSTLPPVIGELVANGWDANATEVEITIPSDPISEETSEILISDNGVGMSDKDIREKYLKIGRDRRENGRFDETDAPFNRKIMGRKGIGKFSAFGIAREIVIESMQNGKISHFRMNYDEILKKADEREILFTPLPPSGNVSEGTRITLKYITKFENRRISTNIIRRGLARRFAIIGPKNKFEVVLNGAPISPADRDLKRLLENDVSGKPYLWKYDDVEIEPDTGWVVSGWIGALKRTSQDIDGIDRGIALMARGKLVQEPFVFDAIVGQQYALSYLIGELHVEFVDEKEDTIGTTRNSLVWDTEANETLKKWGKNEINTIAREWAEKRSKDNEALLQKNKLYIDFQQRTKEIGNKRALKLADQLVRQAITKNPTAQVTEVEPVIQTSLDFLEFDAFWEIAEELARTDIENTQRLFVLFRELEIFEAKEMARVTQGRITAIEKLQYLIEKNALEVPTLQDFLKEFPWVIDPRWTLVDDEVTYSKLLRDRFPESDDLPEENRRIDFLCVREGTNLVVVEIKRAESRVSKDELDQIEEYVNFLRDKIISTTDPAYGYKEVTGYLLCGDLVNTYQARGRRDNLEKAQIYVRRYIDLLTMVQKAHAEFLDRYNQLQAAKLEATKVLSP